MFHFLFLSDRHQVFVRERSDDKKREKKNMNGQMDVRRKFMNGDIP